MPDQFTQARAVLNDELATAVAADPLAALHEIGAVQRDLAEHQSRAVRAAAREHSWRTIGDALGVTKQAAHQRFAKDWANTLKDEIKAEHMELKTALQANDRQRAAAAEAKRDAVIDEFRANRRAQR